MVSEPLTVRRFGGAIGAALTALILITIVHARSGDEVIACAEGRCPIGSGLSWILTGFALMFPFAAVGGWEWTNRLHSQGRLGPFSRRLIPDIEEMAEVLSVLTALGLAYLVITSGPKMPMLEYRWPNSWLEDRLGSEDGVALVPTRTAWFVVGLLISAPFGFAAGTAAGREWFAWRRGPARDPARGDAE